MSPKPTLVEPGSWCLVDACRMSGFRRRSRGRSRPNVVFRRAGLLLRRIPALLALVNSRRMLSYSTVGARELAGMNAMVRASLFWGLLSSCAFVASASAQQINAPTTQEYYSGSKFLFCSQTERESWLRSMDQHFQTQIVKHGDHIRPLESGKPLEFEINTQSGTQSLQSFMAQWKTAGILVLREGRVRLEAYGLGHNRVGRWNSFSVAKSLTSTLAGAAIKDGYIKTVDDPVTDYLPALRGSAYDGVTIRQLLTMTSGVKWNEDYQDPNSDVSRILDAPSEPGVGQIVSYMRRLPRAAEPGNKFSYNTGETHLVGAVVAAATGRPLSEYLSEKIWKPYGMEADAAWVVDRSNDVTGGGSISMRLRDYARVGLFILDGARIGNQPIVPGWWLGTATRKAVDIGAPGRGYGFQWWTHDDGTFEAHGIFGQLIFVDPKRHLVVAISSAWEQATDPVASGAQTALLNAIQTAVDRDPT